MCGEGLVRLVAATGWLSLSVHPSSGCVIDDYDDGGRERKQKRWDKRLQQHLLAVFPALQFFPLRKMLIFDTQIILLASGFSPFIHRGFWTTRHTLWMCLPLCFLAPLHFSPISSSPKLEGCRRAQCLSAIVANMGENGNAL